MRRLALVALLLAALAPAAHAASVANVDVAAAGRSCTTLKGLTGARTFGRLYSTANSCVDSWTLRVHAARVAATAACKAKSLEGILLSACIVKETASILAPKIRTYANAAKACSSELNSIGRQRFTARYGGNAAGAFRVCVSRKVK